MSDTKTRDDAVAEAAAQFREAAAAAKCHACGCLRDTIAAVRRVAAPEALPQELRAALDEAATHLVPPRYDCLGCAVCYPAVAANALNRAGGAFAVGIDACAATEVTEREGWPPLPGDYRVLHHRAPVAVCTLTDAGLADRIAAERPESVSAVGTMQTENLGIERLVRNVVANPNIRFLVVCGADSQGAIGHLPGASLLALSRSGVDARGRIHGAPGKRPVLRNVGSAAVERFRRSVEVVDRIGEASAAQVLNAVASCAARDPGPAEPFEDAPRVEAVPGALPARVTLDPAGYFVIQIDRRRRSLVLEHYRNDGVLDGAVEAANAAEAVHPAIERGWISRLDHAAYLGRELARAERALATDERFRQDAAPERLGGSNCGCADGCAEAGS